MEREVEWVEREEAGWRCKLCPQHCLWNDKSPLGLCRVRGLVEGEPGLPGYGQCVSLSIDPIEKKPLYHFLPGSQILSTGPAGCNLRCDFCQNWTISQTDDTPTRFVSPDDLADLAFREGSRGVAFTYTEPTIWFEYIADVAPLVRERGGSVVMVSNGYVNPDPLERYLEITDAWNVDLKAWTERFYKERCKGHRDPVFDNIARISESDCHLELTFLVIPGENDDPEEWKSTASWLAENVGPKTVLHISRYFPSYRLKRSSTPVEKLRQAKEAFSEVLEYVYLGNVHFEQADTLCSSCGQVLVNRSGYRVRVSGVSDDGRCTSCGEPAPLVTDVGPG